MQAVTHYTGINAETGEYSDFGVPATILGTICVRTALCRRSAISTPFCLINSGGKPREAGTTGGDAGAFEQHIEDDSPLAEVLPSVYTNIRCAIATTPCASCVRRCTSVCQFRRQRPTKSDVPPAEFPSVVMNPQDAHSAYIRGEVGWCGFVMPKGELRQKGRCLITRRALRGTRRSLGWGGSALFLALEEGVNLLPGFSPELQGVIAKPMQMA